MSRFILAISRLTTSNLPWFMDLTFKDAMQYWFFFFFLASDFTFTPKLIYSWASFPLWPCHFILSGLISNGRPLLTSSILDTFWPRGAHLTVSCLFCLFLLSMVFSRQEYWSGLPFPSPVDHVLSELFIMTHLSWVALGGTAHSSLSYASLLVITRLWSMNGILCTLLDITWWKWHFTSVVVFSKRSSLGACW